MKKRLTAFLAALVILCSAALPALAEPAGGEETGLTILFTHDMHDHVLPSPAEGGGEYGGFTRVATLLKQERASSAYPTVTLDGGDFSMGTLYQTIYTTQAPELRLMGAMDIDVTTLGNHEFDFRAAGLAQMLESAAASGDKLPALVQANYKPPKSDTASWEAWQTYGISDYAIVERDGLRIAVFGVLGVDADECAPMSGMEFEPIADAAQRTVAYLEEHEDPDFIICLSHSGTENGKGEDYELAKAVDGIDVIISGHTHTTLTEPIQVNNTLIVSCGEYTQNLGVLTVTKGSDGAVSLEDYRLIPVDETVAEDPSISALAEKFQTRVEEEYLSDYGYTFDQVLATSDFDFTPISQFSHTQEDDSLGSLITDSYIYAVQQAEGKDYVPVDFAVVASGVIRGSFAAGDITVSDAFNVSSLGSGADGTPGYPLVSVYLTGDELKDAFEVDASVTPLMPAAQLYTSGMTWTYNTNRMIFNKVTECGQVLSDGTVIPLEKDKLYRVVTGLYSAQMLGAVNAKSFGLLTITPKDADGNEITDFEAHIIHNVNGSEVKEWYALASYLESLGTVPAEYSAPQGRKVVYSSWSPIQLLKSPNWITLLVLLILVVLIVVIVLVVCALVRRKSKRRYGRGYGGGGPRAYRGRRRRR
ncbi:MAG: bifunctional metallophosphatase/5'-nucleotidase [Oscillospiraceae bacterium]